MAKIDKGPISSSKSQKEEVAALLFAAIDNRRDFVFAWERIEEPLEETKPTAFAITGDLVTPCRLRGILGRATAYEDDGARIVTFQTGKDPYTKKRNRSGN